MIRAASVSAKVNGEVVLLFGWSSAILLQFAHPLVAAAVRDHSGFRGGPLAPWRRLHGTLQAMLALTFGSAEEQARVQGQINAVHDRVNGRLRAAGGPFARGAPYSARDPALLAWVHATCVDVFLRTYERFVGPLTDEERDAYCDDAAAAGPWLGVGDGVLPRTRRELDRYMAAMLAGGEIVVTDTARELARALLRPPLLRAVVPVVALMRLTAAGLLPAGIREAYGFPWGPRRERALDVFARTVRRVVRFTPALVRRWPAARAAARRANVSVA